MFSYDTKVSYSRVDKNEQVPFHEIINYFQDGSTFQSEELGVGVKHMESRGKAWVVVAYRIKINKPITLGQDICIGTAPTDFKGLLASRQYIIKDKQGDCLAIADTIWVLMDLEMRKPMRITDEDVAKYEIEEKFGDVTAKRKLKFVSQGKKLPEFQVLKTYIDSNGHMNHANYLRAAAEFLPEDLACKEIEIVYAKEAMAGEMITPYLHNEENGLGICFENAAGVVLTKILYKTE